MGSGSANEVLAHLRACADVWGGNIERMARRTTPDPRDQSRTWSASTDYLDRPFRPSLRAFTRQRKELLGLLDGLSHREWARGGTFTGAGKAGEVNRAVGGRPRSARHDRAHVKQIARIVESMP